MSKQNLINQLSELSGESKAAVGRVIEALSAHAQAELYTGREVTLPEIGKLKPVEKAARQGRNPQTGESVQIPAKRAVKFTISKILKDSIQ